MQTHTCTAYAVGGKVAGKRASKCLHALLPGAHISRRAHGIVAPIPLVVRAANPDTIPSHAQVSQPMAPIASISQNATEVEAGVSVATDGLNSTCAVTPCNYTWTVRGIG